MARCKIIAQYAGLAVDHCPECGDGPCASFLRYLKSEAEKGRCQKEREWLLRQLNDVCEVLRAASAGVSQSAPTISPLPDNADG